MTTDELHSSATILGARCVDVKPVPCGEHKTMTHSLIHPFTDSLIHPFTHSPLHSFTHSLIHSFTPSPIHPFTHSLFPFQLLTYPLRRRIRAPRGWAVSYR